MTEPAGDYYLSTDLPPWLRRDAEGRIIEADYMEVPAAKPWWQSRAIWGAIMTAAAGLAGLAGYSIDAPAATEAVIGLVSLIGAGLAWWGRVQAERPISRDVVPGVTLPERGERAE